LALQRFGSLSNHRLEPLGVRADLSDEFMVAKGQRKLTADRRDRPRILVREGIDVTRGEGQNSHGSLAVSYGSPADFLACVDPEGLHLRAQRPGGAVMIQDRSGP